VLVPRPETELLAELGWHSLSELKTQDARRKTALDFGTGSGCIAVALARELRHAEIFATDISATALEVARRNAARHGVSGRIQFVQTDLLSAFVVSPLATSHSLALTESEGPLPFDLIVSNPPYVAREDAASLQREVREHEPETALFGGPTGVEIYARLAEQAGRLLRSGGTLVLELGFGAADQVRALVAAQGIWVNTSITKDLAGIPRVLATERA